MDIVQRLEVYSSAYEWDVETQLSMAKRMLRVAERFGSKMMDEEFNLIDEEEKDWRSPSKSQSK
jgi:hypothetical protein|tara:strand:- start:56 stop:247 length:192 start_codon:yes stop_codon:yes gene_type:complete